MERVMGTMTTEFSETNFVQVNGDLADNFVSVPRIGSWSDAELEAALWLRNQLKSNFINHEIYALSTGEKWISATPLNFKKSELRRGLENYDKNFDFISEKYIKRERKYIHANFYLINSNNFDQAIHESRINRRFIIFICKNFAKINFENFLEYFYKFDLKLNHNFLSSDNAIFIDKSVKFEIFPCRSFGLFDDRTLYFEIYNTFNIKKQFIN